MVLNFPFYIVYDLLVMTMLTLDCTSPDAFYVVKETVFEFKICTATGRFWEDISFSLVLFLLM